MTAKKKTLRELKNVQLRSLTRGKSITLFLNYTLNGVQKYENLKTVPAWNRQAYKDALAQCEVIARQRDAELEQGIAGAEYLHAKQKSFMEFFRLVLASKKHPKAYKNALLKLTGFLASFGKADITFGELTKNFAMDYRDYLYSLYEKEQLSGTTAHKYLELFRAVINEALRRELLIKNPCVGLKPIPKDTPEREFLTVEELRKLVQTPLPSCIKFDNQVFAGFFLFSCLTGIRPNDVRGLRWQDIQTTDGQNYFVVFMPSKTKSKLNQTLVVPLHPEALKVLEAMRSKPASLSAATDKIFVPMPHERAKNTLNNFLRVWLRRAGIEKTITAYNARHTFASNLILSGVGIFEVSKLLGHSSLRHTQIYSHLTVQAAQTAVNKMPAIDISFERRAAEPIGLTGENKFLNTKRRD
jgi:integrase